MRINRYSALTHERKAMPLYVQAHNNAKRRVRVCAYARLYVHMQITLSLMQMTPH